jgi:hypothetical protein
MRGLPQLWTRHHRRIVILIGIILMATLAAWLVRSRLTEPIDSYAACTQAGYPILDSEPPVCVAKGHSFLGPRSYPTLTPEPVISQDFQLLVEGDSRGGYPKRQEVIATQAEWARYWNAVHAAIKPVPPILPVDFGASQVVALSEGRQPTGGYNLKITGITSTSAGTTIDVTEQTPDGGCVVAQGSSNRYYIVRTPKLPPPVSFRTTVEKHACH